MSYRKIKVRLTKRGFLVLLIPYLTGSIWYYLFSCRTLSYILERLGSTSQTSWLQQFSIFPLFFQFLAAAFSLIKSINCVLSMCGLQTLRRGGEWVGSYITYETENSTSYHWQFPKETLQSRYGMCVDYSTLLVSLYRDGVFGPNDTYVVFGTGQRGYHAWVIVNLPIFGWYTLDPQENGNFLVNLVQNPFVVSGYKAQYEFNDQQFYTLG